MSVRAAAAAVDVASVNMSPVNMSVVPNFRRNEMELAVAHAALARGLVRKRPQLGGRAAQDGDLQAGVVVEMDMHGGHLQVVMTMLRFGEPLAKRTRLVIVDIGQGGDTESVARRCTGRAGPRF